jgi:hypothetical protein
MTTVTFMPVSIICPICQDELPLSQPFTPVRVACSRCRRTWELTLPTVDATEVSYSKDRDSLEP